MFVNSCLEEMETGIHHMQNVVKHRETRLKRGKVPPSICLPLVIEHIAGAQMKWICIVDPAWLPQAGPDLSPSWPLSLSRNRDLNPRICIGHVGCAGWLPGNAHLSEMQGVKTESTDVLRWQQHTTKHLLFYCIEMSKNAGLDFDRFCMLADGKLRGLQMKARTCVGNVAPEQTCCARRFQRSFS